MWSKKYLNKDQLSGFDQYKVGESLRKLSVSWFEIIRAYPKPQITSRFKSFLTLRNVKVPH